MHVLWETEPCDRNPDLVHAALVSLQVVRGGLEVAQVPEHHGAVRSARGHHIVVVACQTYSYPYAYPSEIQCRSFLTLTLTLTPTVPLKERQLMSSECAFCLLLMGELPPLQCTRQDKTRISDGTEAASVSEPGVPQQQLPVVAHGSEEVRLLLAPVHVLHHSGVAPQHAQGRHLGRRMRHVPQTHQVVIGRSWQVRSGWSTHALTAEQVAGLQRAPSQTIALALMTCVHGGCMYGVDHSTVC